MESTLSIPKIRTRLPAEDYDFLREAGIEHLKKLGTNIWTDFNLHDPGITMLELIAYAITDLGNRTSFDIKDIVTPAPGSEDDASLSFHSAANIFPCNPITINGLRKIMIDVEGVRNAWLDVLTEPACDCEQIVYLDCEACELTLEETDTPLYLNGLYNVKVLYEEDLYDPTTGDLDAELSAPVVRALKETLHAHRNLGEDFCPKYKTIRFEDIAICAEIEVTPVADINKILAEIYYQVGLFFNPPVPFYSIQEMLDKGLTPDQVFEGAALDHGFIDNEDLKAAQLKKDIKTSDIYNIIMDIEGVIAVRSLIISNYLDGTLINEGEKWCLSLAEPECRVPRIMRENSSFLFLKKELPFFAEPIRTQEYFLALKGQDRSAKLGFFDSDFGIPEGEYKSLETWFPLTNEMPMLYGVGPESLPTTTPTFRKARAKQLKSFLLLFEQVLANYMSQLAHVKDLFSWQEAKLGEPCPPDPPLPTYFTQKVTGIKNIAELYALDYDTALDARLGELIETEEIRIERRNRFLDHMLARFAEEMTDLSLIQFSLQTEGAGDELICDKARFLRDYPTFSRDRGKGFDMLRNDGMAYPGYEMWDTDNVQGMAMRISRKLGIDNVFRRNLVNCGEYEIVEDVDEMFHFVLTLPDEVLPVGIPLIQFTGATAKTRAAALDVLERTFELGEDPENCEDIDGADFSFLIRDLNAAGIQAVTSFEVGVDIVGDNTALEILVNLGEAEISIADLLDIAALDNTASALAIAAAINLASSTTGFCATSDGAVVTVIAPRGTDSEANAYSLILRELAIDLFTGTFAGGEDGLVLATSNVFATAGERDDAKDAALAYFLARDEEGMHIVEHILLRPKVTDDPLLPACVTCSPSENPEEGCGLLFSIQNMDGEVTYGFRVTALVNDATTEFLRAPEGLFPSPIARNEALARFPDLAADYANFQVLPDGSGFIVGDGEGPVAQSSKLYTSLDEISDDIDAIRNFYFSLINPAFSLEVGEPTQNICAYDNDPYSFRVSVVLPGWGNRFGSPEFRAFAERVIREETPAHVYPKICWIDRNQMCDFEICYQAWLEGNAPNVMGDNMGGVDGISALAGLTIHSVSDADVSYRVEVTEIDALGIETTVLLAEEPGTTLGATDPSILATTISDLINTNTGVHGYVATAAVDVVTITAPDGTFTLGNQYGLIVTDLEGGAGFSFTNTDFEGGFEPAPSEELGNLIECLSVLKNYFPSNGRLHDCTVGDDSDAIVLGKSNI